MKKDAITLMMDFEQQAVPRGVCAFKMREQTSPPDTARFDVEGILPRVPDVEPQVTDTHLAGPDLEHDRVACTDETAVDDETHTQSSGIKFHILFRNRH